MMEIANISILAAVYLIFNIAAFGAYGFDKAKAAMDKWRTPEKTLLILAVFGPFGAYAGMRVFRHKTQKKPFTWAVPLFLFIHVIFIGIILFLN